MSRLQQVIHEIHRRSLWQVLGIYGVGSWLTLQVVDTLAGALNLPAWAPSLALFLLIIGLPIVLATAFVQKGIGPQRAQALSEEPDTASQVQAATAGGEPDLPVHWLSWRNAIMGGILAFAMWGVVAAGWMAFGARRGDPVGPSVAVLPFADESAEGGEGAAFFANGIHDEILTQLSRIGSLKVISRTSVMEYRDASRNIREIAEQLGVGAVLEGAVRRAGDRVRINVQLIDAATDDHLWANTYEEELTTENIFAIQADVARQISRELRAELSAEEDALLDARPTDDLTAYDFFLRAVARLDQSYAEADLRFAVEMFTEAVRIDPSFAVAYARLAQAHAEIFWFAYDRTPERRGMVEEAVAKARELAPDHPETHLAAGVYHYRIQLDFENALRELEVARSLWPGSPQILTTVGYIQNRMGLFELGAESIRRGLELDPNSGRIIGTLGVIEQLVRNYDEARRLFDRVIQRTPSWPSAIGYRALLSLLHTGETAEARQILEDGQVAGARVIGEAVLGRAWIAVLLHEGSYDELLHKAESESWGTVQGQNVYWPLSLVRAWAFDLKGDGSRATQEFEASVQALEAVLQTNPEDQRVVAALGFAHAGLGEAAAAATAAERAVELMPKDRDANRAIYRLEDQAFILATVGAHDEAIARFEELLDQPGRLTAAYLQRSPRLEGLRTNPRFLELLDRE